MLAASHKNPCTDSPGLRPIEAEFETLLDRFPGFIVLTKIVQHACKIVPGYGALRV